MQLPGCYNENLIDAVDICDPVDVALMTESEDAIVEDEMMDEELDAMIAEVEAGINEEDDDTYGTSYDPIDVDIDEEIECDVDGDEDGELIDIVDGETGY